MLPLAAASGVLGLVQTLEGLRGLNSMGSKPLDQLSPEELLAYNQSQERAQYGYSGAQEAALEQNRSRGENTAFQRAYNSSSGNQGSAINAALRSMDLMSRNNQAFSDATLKEHKQQYADRRGDVITGDRHRITGEKRMDWDQRAKAFGGAMQSGITNLTNMFNLNQALSSFKNPANVGKDHDIVMSELTRQLKLGKMFGEGGSNPIASDNEPADVSSPDANSLFGYNQLAQLQLPH